MICVDPLCPCGGACDHPVWSDDYNDGSDYVDTSKGPAKGVIVSLLIELALVTFALVVAAYSKGWL